MPDDARPAVPVVEVRIPADLAERLGGAGPGLDRRAVEALAIAAYQAGEFTAYEVQLALGIETRYELDGFLKARGVFEPVTMEDIRRDVETLKRLGF